MGNNLILIMKYKNFFNQTLTHKKPDHRRLGFSLLELSIVLIIISVLMVAVIKGSDLIDQARLSSAGQKTINSPVLKINGLLAWFETTLPNSFLDKEIKNNGAISTWNDSSGNNPLNKLALTQIAPKQPLYISNAINNIPSLQFNGVDNFLKNLSFHFPYNDYQIFVVFQLSDNSINRDIISFDAATLHGFLLETQPNGVLRTLHRFPYGASGNEDSFVSATGSFSINKNYIISYDRNSISTNSVARLNGVSTTSGTTTRPGFDGADLDLYVGSLLGTNRYFKGFISEIIIYSRALSNQERQDVERYLSDKYQITIS